MLMINFLKNRRSIREYKNKKIGEDTKKQVIKVIDELQEEYGNKHFEFILFEDGDRIFKLLDGLAGYSGVMIESPHYIGIRLNNMNTDSIINSSFYGEKLMTKLGDLNLGSCWVRVKDVDESVKSNAFGEENKDMDYIIAFGYPKAKNPLIQEPYSSRLSIQEIVFNQKLGQLIDIEELEKRGLDDLFYYVRFAPSNYNKQPWRFILKEDKVVLLLEVEEENKEIFIDGGIIMYYFAELAKTIGINKKWKLLDSSYIEHEGKKYLPIGEYQL